LVNLSTFSKENVPQLSYLKVNGIKLHYLSGGKKGPLILLIHGFPEYSGAWTP
jgi:pimeloyl-ACP methyl ester carboxylesterase